MGTNALSKTSRLTHLEDVGRDSFYRMFCKYRCVCGTEKKIRRDHVISNHIISCGCAQKEITRVVHTTHGHATRKPSPLYRRWDHMIGRCYRASSSNYAAYGGKGIRVYEPWHDFENWLAYMGPSYFPDACQDRINPHKNYEPGNVQWLSRSDNSKKMYTDRFKYEDLTREQIEVELNG